MSWSGLLGRLRSGLVALDYYTLLDIIWGLRTINREFTLISQRRSGNLLCQNP